MQLYCLLGRGFSFWRVSGNRGRDSTDLCRGAAVQLRQGRVMVYEVRVSAGAVPIKSCLDSELQSISAVGYLRVIVVCNGSAGGQNRGWGFRFRTDSGIVWPLRLYSITSMYVWVWAAGCRIGDGTFDTRGLPVGG